jgi:PAS domain S-box-containing protein
MSSRARARSPSDGSAEGGRSPAAGLDARSEDRGVRGRPGVTRSRIAAWNERLFHLLALPVWSAPAPLRYAVALLIVAAATALRWALLPWMGAIVPYNLALLAIVASTVLLGTGPGLVTALLAVLGVEAFVVSPSGRELGGAALGRLGASLAIGAFVCALLHAFRVAQREARSQAARALAEVGMREEAQGALRESEQRYATLFERAPFAVALSRMEGGRTVSVNDAFLRLFELTRGEVIGQANVALGASDPAARARVAEELGEHGFVRGLEVTRKTRSGAERTLSLSMDRVAIAGQDHVLAAAVDITERKRADDRARKEQRETAIANRLLAIFVEHDGEEMFHEALTVVREAMASQHGVFGYIAEPGHLVCPSLTKMLDACEVEGKCLDYPPERWNGLWARALRERRSFFTNEAPRVPPGHPTIHNNLAAPILFRGEAIGLLNLANKEGGYGEDDRRALDGLAARVAPMLYAWLQRKLRQEDRQRAQEALRESEHRLRLALRDAQHANLQLAEANRRKNEFLAVLSHELRNPLAPIVNSLYVLDHAPPDGDQATRARQIIGRQVTQLSELVNDLLDVTRITRNRVELQMDRLELYELVRRAVEDNRSLFERAGVCLDLAPASLPVPVIADPTRLSQVVGNLLQNSAKFTSRGGHTRVSVAVDGSEAVLRVADDGAGMEGGTLARLFQPFAQADQTLDRSKGGLGLGLALVKGLVELHGGRVSARSDGPGKGSEFLVRLPLDTGAALEPVVVGVCLARARWRILIIDGDADAANGLRAALELGDHEVAVACDGLDGLTKARAFQPQVVFCDIGLQGMDGFQVAQALRADVRLEGAQLVALGGHALPEDLRRASEAGFQRHIAKPPSLEKLEHLLADLGASI